MCGGWGPQTRVGSGIGCRTSLPRRRWSSLNECDVEGLGKCMAEDWRLLGLPHFTGAQLAIDTTMVSPLHRDGRATRGAASTPGVALRRARRRKEQSYPELHGAGGRGRLVVLAAEVGGVVQRSCTVLWGTEQRSKPPLLQRSFVNESRALGFVGGGTSSYAMQQRFSLCPCWTSDL